MDGLTRRHMGLACSEEEVRTWMDTYVCVCVWGGVIEVILHMEKENMCVYASIWMFWAAGGGTCQARSPLGNCLFHIVCNWGWTVPSLCLLALWSQECTYTNLSSSTRCGIWIVGKRNLLFSLWDFKDHIEELLTPHRDNIWGWSHTEASRGEREKENSDFIFEPMFLDLSQPGLVKFGFLSLS